MEIIETNFMTGADSSMWFSMLFQSYCIQKHSVKIFYMWQKSFLFTWKVVQEGMTLTQIMWKHLNK